MLTAAHAMQTSVETVPPTMGLVDLERRLLTLGLNGFPVIEEGKLVGIVSRSDVVRLLGVERSVAEQVSDFYRSFEDPARAADAAAEAASVASAVGERASTLSVRDAMIRQVVSTDSDCSQRADSWRRDPMTLPPAPCWVQDPTPANVSRRSVPRSSNGSTD